MFFQMSVSGRVSCGSSETLYLDRRHVRTNENMWIHAQIREDTFHYLIILLTLHPIIFSIVFIFSSGRYILLPGWFYSLIESITDRVPVPSIIYFFHIMLRPSFIPDDSQLHLDTTHPIRQKKRVFLFTKICTTNVVQIIVN